MTHKANADNDDAIYAEAFRPEQYELQAEHRIGGTRVEEDARRFACDRCRSQKLRCERDRLSLHSPLKSTPCRRCVKARVRCTISTHPRNTQVQGDATASSQKRRATHNRNSSGMSLEIRQDSAGSEDMELDDEDEHETPRNHHLHKRVRRPDSRMASDDKATRSSAINTDSIAAGLGSTAATNSFGDPSSVVDPALLRDHARPRSGGTMQNKEQHIRNSDPAPSNNNMQRHLQPGRAVSSAHMTPPAEDAEFDHELDHLMLEIDSTGAVIWSQSSLMNSSNSTAYNQDTLDFAAGRVEMHPSFDPISRGDPSRTGTRDAAKLLGFQENAKSALLVPGVNQSGYNSCELAAQLAQLTETILSDMSRLDQIECTITDIDVHAPGPSPMSRILSNAERFSAIMTENFLRHSDNSPDTNLSEGSLNRCKTDADGRFTHSKPSGNAIASMMPNTGHGLLCGLPGLTTLMAIFAAYSGILQAYERLYERIRRVVLNKGRSGNMLATLLPLTQLDGVKVGAQNTSLHVHVGMEVSVQMLNQIENKLALIVTAYASSCEDTKASLLALLQSLTHNQGDIDVATPSAMIRETINEVKMAFAA